MGDEVEGRIPKGCEADVSGESRVPTTRTETPSADGLAKRSGDLPTRAANLRSRQAGGDSRGYPERSTPRKLVGLSDASRRGRRFIGAS